MFKSGKSRLTRNKHLGKRFLYTSLSLLLLPWLRGPSRTRSLKKPLCFASNATPTQNRAWADSHNWSAHLEYNEPDEKINEPLVSLIGHSDLR